MAIAKSKVNKISYIEHSDYVEGILPDGTSFLFNYDVYEFVKENMWHKTSEKELYIRSTQHGSLHRYVMRDELSGALQVDHINRNRLDNRRSNLRVVTKQENLHNKSMYKTNTSGHVGVKWNKKLNKWQAQITRNKVRRHLGVFDELQDAIVARKKAEKA